MGMGQLAEAHVFGKQRVATVSKMGMAREDVGCHARVAKVVIGGQRRVRPVQPPLEPRQNLPWRLLAPAGTEGLFGRKRRALLRRPKQQHGHGVQRRHEGDLKFAKIKASQDCNDGH